MAYEVKWLFQPELSKSEDGQKVTIQKINGLAISRYFPLKQVSTIMHTEVEKNQVSKRDYCQKEFFPHQGLKLSHVTIGEARGMKVITGFWNEAFKYLVFTCKNTKKGYITSNAVIRMPFLKRYAKTSYMIMMDRALGIFSHPEKYKTSFLENLYRKFMNSINMSAHAQGLGGIGLGGGSGAGGGLSGTLTVAGLGPTNTAINNLTDQAGVTTVEAVRESDQWQVESQTWRTFLGDKSDEWGIRLDGLSDTWKGESDEWQGLTGEALKLAQEESDQWQALSEQGIQAIYDTQSFLGETLSSGNLFKLALSTAAGAAIGGFGVNLALNGITQGVGAFITYLAGLKQMRRDELARAEESFAELQGAFDTLGEDLDRLVLSLPMMAELGDDIYGTLEEELAGRISDVTDVRGRHEVRIQTKRDQLAEEIYTLTSMGGNEERIAGLEACQKALKRPQFILDMDRQIGDMTKVLEMIQGLQGDLNQGKYGFSGTDFCGRIKDMLHSWKSAEAKVVTAQAMLRKFGPVKAGIVDDEYKAMRKVLDDTSLERWATRDLNRTQSKADSILKRAHKDLTKHYKDRYFKGTFKQKYTSCRENWCHTRIVEGNSEVSVGLYPSSQLCSAVVSDLGDGVIGPPSNLDLLVNEGIVGLDDEQEFHSSSTGAKQSAMLKLYELNSGTCFNRLFKVHYPEEYEKQIKCDDEAQRHRDGGFGSFATLAKCSEDFNELREVHNEISGRVAQAQGKTEQIGSKGELKLAAAKEALDVLSEHAEGIVTGLDLLEEPMKPYKYQALIDLYCKDDKLSNKPNMKESEENVP